MSAENWFLAATAFVWPVVCAVFWQVMKISKRISFTADWLVAAVGITVSGIFTRTWPFVLGAGVSALIAAWLWWRNRRRDRKRAPRAYGAKTRALLAAIARRAREVARPRPVLRPVPGGAR